MNNNNSLSEQLGGLLRSKGLLMGTAESCTGGRIANMVTLVAGSSDYFVGGVVSYSNEVKHNVLGVSEDSLRLHGAVSREVVEQMAQGAIRTLGCDCSVATSGVAGPGGGSPEKPVGTVWIAAALKEQVVSHCYHFGTGRKHTVGSRYRFDNVTGTFTEVRWINS
jgi:nicotinamide-nucleotide amidase